MRHKIIAGGLALTLTAFAAMGAFASQDGVSFKSLLSGGVLGSEVQPAVGDTATATATETATETTTATETATETPTATAGPTDTATPSASGEDHEDEGDSREIKGIPTTNPSHHPEDGDGECERGETVVKTTPSGTKVNVPCQAAGEHGHSGEHHSSHNNSGESGDQNNDQEDDDGGLGATPTPQATTTP